MIEREYWVKGYSDHLWNGLDRNLCNLINGILHQTNEAAKGTVGVSESEYGNRGSAIAQASKCGYMDCI